MIFNYTFSRAHDDERLMNKIVYLLLLLPTISLAMDVAKYNKVFNNPNYRVRQFDIANDIRLKPYLHQPQQTHLNRGIH